MVAQNHDETGTAAVTTIVPTVQRFTRLLALSLEVLMKRTSIITHNTTQTYIQFEIPLERVAYKHIPSRMSVATGHASKIVKPRYGIPPAGFNCYLTCTTHELETFGKLRS